MNSVGLKAVRSFSRGCGPNIGNMCQRVEAYRRTTCFTSCDDGRDLLKPNLFVSSLVLLALIHGPKLNCVLL